jgi:hypothetical protein
MLRPCASWGDRGLKNMGFPHWVMTGLAQCTPRVVLDAVDLAVDRVGLHVRPLSCDGLLMQVSQS